MRSVETMFEVWILVFPRTSGMMLSPDAAGRPQRPVGSVTTRVKHRSPLSHSVPIHPLFFTFSTVFGKLHELGNTSL